MLTKKYISINLGALYCKFTSSNDIFLKLKAYDALQSIAMIVDDNNGVNIGRSNGVVVTIQNEMEKFGYSKPKFI